jgi:peptide chain release factor 1
MSIDSSMDKVLERRQEVETQLSRSAELSSKELADFSRELSELRPVCEQIELVRSLESELQDAMTMIAEAAGDQEMQAMAEAEVALLKDRIPGEKDRLQLLLLPKDKDDSRNAILEVRAGTGGDEAALFGANLFSMYQRFAAKNGWRFEVMEVSETGIGGYNLVCIGYNASQKPRLVAAFIHLPRPLPCFPKPKKWTLMLMRMICGLTCFAPLARGGNR